MNAREFVEFMNQPPVFDEKIMESIRLKDSWVGSVCYGGMPTEVLYLETLEAVRKLSEGMHYRPTYFGGDWKKKIK